MKVLTLSTGMLILLFAQTCIGQSGINQSIKTNPNYAPNVDWAVAESMQATGGKKIVLFLKTNIDRYISVINSAIDYCQKNTEIINSSIDALVSRIRNSGVWKEKPFCWKANS